MFTRFLMPVVVLMLIATPLYAQKARFENLSEGMVEALTNESESVKSVNLKIEFDVNSDRIRPASHAVLEELCKALNHPRLTGQAVIIKGHTDSDGPDDYNLNLSEMRALSVRKYLEEYCRIELERMKIEGCGEKFPLAPNTTARNKQKNRRVEIQVDSGPAPAPENQGVGFQSLDN